MPVRREAQTDDIPNGQLLDKKQYDAKSCDNGRAPGMIVPTNRWLTERR